MKKTVLCLLGIALMAACGHKADRDTLVRDIEELEQGFEYDIVGDTDLDSNANAMIALYRQFYTQYPADSLTPVYMQRAADLNISLGDPDAAIAILDSIITLHPDYSDVAGCWFLKGYAYETAENYDSARVVYTHFVDTYPDHYLANDTRVTIKYLGLTPEEMFEAIISGATVDNLVMRD